MLNLTLFVMQKHHAGIFQIIHLQSFSNSWKSFYLPNKVRGRSLLFDATIIKRRRPPCPALTVRRYMSCVDKQELSNVIWSRLKAV